MTKTDRAAERGRLIDRPVAGVLHEARQLHLAISTKRGLHITPALYSLADGRVWFFAGATTLKARVITTGDRGGALVRAGDQCVSMAGRLERVDLLAPVQLARASSSVAALPAAVAGFVLRNAVDLVGFAGDTLAGRTGSPVVSRRVLFALVPDRVAFLEAGVLTEARGRWPGSPGPRRRSSGQRPGHGGVAGPAVVAWSGPDGPLALPARWQPENLQARVPAALLDLSGAARRGAAAVVVDDYGRPGPSGKQGSLLRGVGSFGGVAGGWRSLHLDPVRMTTWAGVTTSTEGLS